MAAGWAYNLRNCDQATDSESDGNSPTASKECIQEVSEDTKLLHELDLSSRQDEAIYKANPWTIAKLNAATRPTDAVPRKSHQTSSFPRAKIQPSNGPYVGSKKQPERSNKSKTSLRPQRSRRLPSVEKPREHSPKPRSSDIGTRIASANKSDLSFAVGGRVSMDNSCVHDPVASRQLVDRSPVQHKAHIPALIEAQSIPDPRPADIDIVAAAGATFCPVADECSFSQSASNDLNHFPMPRNHTTSMNPVNARQRDTMYPSITSAIIPPSQVKAPPNRTRKIAEAGAQQPAKSNNSQPRECSRIAETDRYTRSPLSSPMRPGLNRYRHTSQRQTASSPVRPSNSRLLTAQFPGHAPASSEPVQHRAGAFLTTRAKAELLVPKLPSRLAYTIDSDSIQTSTTLSHARSIATSKKRDAYEAFSPSPDREWSTLSRTAKKTKKHYNTKEKFDATSGTFCLPVATGANKPSGSSGSKRPRFQYLPPPPAKKDRALANHSTNDHSPAKDSGTRVWKVTRIDPSQIDMRLAAVAISGIMTPTSHE
ncbi:hypothetical protein NM688_g1312 [Phlebia brevispora]|uniref:Uncharacterized protein n=1 Tax=Phlebia brevispora TaxID=194682 RepID=A0ACC1TBV2_9APHY|nr:hypothetical protein NM688_g1312 [Phlebia brevispora]